MIILTLPGEATSANIFCCDYYFKTKIIDWWANILYEYLMIMKELFACLAHSAKKNPGSWSIFLNYWVSYIKLSVKFFIWILSMKILFGNNYTSIICLLLLQRLQVVCFLLTQGYQSFKVGKVVNEQLCSAF